MTRETLSMEGILFKQRANLERSVSAIPKLRQHGITCRRRDNSGQSKKFHQDTAFLISQNYEVYLVVSGLSIIYLVYHRCKEVRNVPAMRDDTEQETRLTRVR